MHILKQFFGTGPRTALSRKNVVESGLKFATSRRYPFSSDRDSSPEGSERESEPKGAETTVRHLESTKRYNNENRSPSPRSRSGSTDRLPNAAGATIPDGKAENYFLNEEHSTGRHKARVIKSMTGFTSKDAQEFNKQLLEHVQGDHEASQGEINQYGEKWTVRTPLKGPEGEGEINAHYLHDSDKNTTKLVTVTPVKKKKGPN